MPKQVRVLKHDRFGAALRAGYTSGHPGSLSRRGLLQFGAAVTAASLCGGCRWFGSREADVVAARNAGAIHLSPEESARLLQSEGSLLVKSPGVQGKVLAIRARDSRLYAVNSVCTHMGCDVLYDKDLGHIRCPCHGSEYGLDGRNIKGPARRPLAPYRIHTSDGRVVIEV